MKLLRPVGVILAVLAIAEMSMACTGVAPENATPVQIAEENALIIYDAKTGVEQFVRQGVFHTDLPDFGFLVPTPTPPTLTETDPAVLTTLHDWTRPKNVDFDWWWFGPEDTSYMTSSTGPILNHSWVTVTRQHVGDFDAAILRANDASALTVWLKTHNYTIRPAQKKWLAYYVRKGWTITVFRVSRSAAQQKTIEARQGGGDTVTLSPIRMTFTTPRAFYPYHESDDEKPFSGRLLRLFCITQRRVIGETEPDSTTKQTDPWSPVSLQVDPWYPVSMPLSENQIKDVSQQLNLPEGTLRDAGTRLTVLEDDSPSRNGQGDLYLKPSPDQREFFPYTHRYRRYHDLLKEPMFYIWTVISAGFTVALLIKRRK